MRYFFFLLSVMLVFSSEISAQQQQEPWNSNQLMKTSALASRINNGETKNLLILSIGPGAIIKGSVDIGPAGEQKNIKKLKNYLNNVSKDEEVVIYCGCCPFDKCPNIRPAFRLLKEMDFKHTKLLDIPQNIKVDWIDKDYPAND